MIEVQPSPLSWKRLERELDLRRYRTPWQRRLSFWRGLAVAASIALAIAIGVNTLSPQEPVVVQVAQLTSKDGGVRVTAALSRDRRTMKLQAERPVIAGPAQSYELWLLPSDKAAPLSLAVLGSLDARFAVSAAHADRVKSGAKLAVSVEPAGGSSTGGPTGPVILTGAISL